VLANVDADLDALSRQILGAAFEVSNTLGHGFLEKVYQRALRCELEGRGLKVATEVSFDVSYKGRQVGTYIADLLVENSIIVELKAVEVLLPVHLAQVITYLKLTGCPAGLLMNFNTTSLRSGLKRLDHPDLHQKNKTTS